MALSKTVTTLHGLEIPNAYHRVENVTLTSKTEMAFFIRSYKDVNHPFFAEAMIECPYNLSGTNPIQQAYEYLKTTNDFAESGDV